MKKLIAAAAMILSLTGCVAVPVYESAPAYGYYYGPPAATFSFGYHQSRHGHSHRRGGDHGPRHRRSH